MAIHLQKKAADQFDHLVKKHPCLGGEAHSKYGRVHLPVSPACNIQCRFCKRTFNKWEKRPGVAASLLTPEKALEIVDRALELCPEITVVGIAGPGDTLATPHALEAFRQVHAKYPDLIKCLSTNGLLLAEKAEEIAQAGVKTLTVTVNAVDPEIQAQICSHIYYEGDHLTGLAAAARLIENQLAGIRKISELGVVVKINTVLIPGINDHHTSEIAKTTKEAGADMINIIPLIPQHELADKRPPGCRELNLARAAAEEYLTVFRHCKQCRADACGIPGKGIELAELLYDQPLETFSHG